MHVNHSIVTGYLHYVMKRFNNVTVHLAPQGDAPVASRSDPWVLVYEQPLVMDGITEISVEPTISSQHVLVYSTARYGPNVNLHKLWEGGILHVGEIEVYGTRGK